MEVDTAASLTVLNESTYSRIGTNPELKPTAAKLSTYTGELLPVLGTVDVNVVYQSYSLTLPAIVVKGTGPNLFGRDWMSAIRLDWSQIHSVRSTTSLELVLQKHSAVFRDEVGLMKTVKATLHVKPDVQPRYFRPRHISFHAR